jgi:hypothetical protein
METEAQAFQQMPSWQVVDYGAVAYGLFRDDNRLRHDLEVGRVTE